MYFWIFQGSNARLQFSISEVEALQTLDGMRVRVPTSFFIINPTTADITVNTSLEREAAVDGFHYYEITVSTLGFSSVDMLAVP